ncbi:MAG: hypothetical protein LCH78_10505 [Proteobacteria bacterium]|nr:hypothetical protein [Pseudomonadota bacterium]
MKKIAQRTPATRTQKLAIGMAASSGSLVVATIAARDMGGPLLAVGLALGLAVLWAILFLALRERPSKNAKAPATTEQDGAVESLAAL